jgi:hypothetical protein
MAGDVRLTGPRKGNDTIRGGVIVESVDMVRSGKK